MKLLLRLGSLNKQFEKQVGSFLLKKAVCTRQTALKEIRIFDLIFTLKMFYGFACNFFEQVVCQTAGSNSEQLRS